MKYEITDKASYTTVYFTVEREDGREYRVSLAENDFHDDYQVMDENGDVIDNDDPLAEMLIELCDKELKK
jgi:hypothetical protein